ncbi:chromosome segregation protein SMC [Alkanindiges illinoisensis]|uniref:chromosome segregation protein SMC n=1 Tax=Alkanindiges illinoisensis TaxID=197183 RepID=UPI00047A6877|nr:chromosome segregation protein SMC [Alkanindiges illinoisensis]
MRLISLKLVGFKSFVDSTTLVFPDNRTAVVGPNGCGKSNVIDAIRWVMGESSARQLRGGAMTDVIFAGTAQRKPVGQASVELRFENTLGKLGGEYNAYSELSVRRQVNRDGRSDYFLNGTRCRRRDITDIFLGTGLGPRSYAIIEQGMINRLVDAKPEEMRVFIEEAAGVSRYQARRRETLQHLEHTRQNLSRLEDINDELQSQMRSLKRQSQAAIKYHELEQQQLDLKIKVWSAHYRQAEQNQQRYTEQLTQLGEQYRELRSHRNQAEADWESGSQQLSGLLARAEPIQQAWQQAEREVSQLAAKVQQYQLDQQQRETQIQQWQDNLKTLTSQIAQDQERLTALVQQLESGQQQFLDTETQFQQKLAHLQHIEQQYQQVEADWQTSQQQAQQFTQQQQRLQQQIDSTARAQLRLEQQIQQASAQLEQLKSSAQQAELDHVLVELDDAQLGKTRLEQQQQQVQAALSQYQQQLDQVRQALKQQQAEFQQYSTELHAIQKLQATQKLQANKAGQSKNEKNVKAGKSYHQENHHKETQTENFSPVATVQLLQQLQLQPQAQPHLPLIEKFLADWLNADLQDSFANTSTAPRAYLANADQLENASGLHCLQHEQVTPLASWVKPCLSCWQAVGIVPDYSIALHLQSQLNSHQSLLSLDGFWLGQNWHINLNIDEQAARQQGILQQQLRQQELQQILHQLQQHIEPLERQQQELLQQITLQQDSLKPVEQKLAQANQAQRQLELQRARLESSLQAGQQQVVQLLRQLEELQHSQQDDQEQVTEWQMELASLNLRLNQLNPRLQAQQDSRNQLQQAVQDARIAHQVTQQHHQQLQATQHSLTVQLQATRQSLQRAEPQQQQIQGQLVQLEQALIQAQALHPTQLQQLEQAQEKAAQAHVSWSTWQQQLEFRQQEQQRLSQLRQQGQSGEDQLRDSLEQTRLHWQDCKNRMEQALEQLAALQISAEPHPENESMTHKTIQPEQVEISQLADWQQQLEKVQQQIQKLGQLNLAAPEALQDVTQRHEELAHQMHDLQQAVEQLEQAMKSIDQETRTLFMSTFDQVNAELKILFPKVFGGGEASLSLEDDWQSGVKLMARPPGKRNSSLALLSGGEKALTALALVFAIFRLNPAPFCVLDEVDAPLDDANVQRFCHLVKELSQQVQFIYITHNKLAMTMATDLLGVTMPEPGASRLVAVNIEQAATYSATSE